jgi:hypothetical protein
MHEPIMGSFIHLRKEMEVMFSERTSVNSKLSIFNRLSYLFTFEVPLR